MTEEKLLNHEISRHSFCISCKKPCLEIAFKICSSCKMVSYCSKECQIKHWKIHKNECKRDSLKELEQEYIKQIRIVCTMLLFFINGYLITMVDNYCKKSGKKRKDIVITTSLDHVDVPISKPKEFCTKYMEITKELNVEIETIFMLSKQTMELLKDEYAKDKDLFLARFTYKGESTVIAMSESLRKIDESHFI